MESSIERVLPRILGEVKEVIEKVSQAEVEALADAIMHAEGIFLCGAGRVGISSRALAMRLVHMGKQTHWVNDDTTPGIGSNDLLIANSGSGGSASTYNIVSQAKEAGSKIATITANPEGKITLLADVVVLLPAQTYKMGKSDWSSILPMGSQFELCLWILQDILCLTLSEKMGITEAQMSARHRNLE